MKRSATVTLANHIRFRDDTDHCLLSITHHYETDVRPAQERRGIRQWGVGSNRNEAGPCHRH